MKVSVSFDELQKVANENLNTGALSFAQVDAKTVRVTYKMFLTVTIELRIEDIVGRDLMLSYSGGAAAGMAVNGLLGLVKDKPELAFVEAGCDNRLVLHLDQIEKVRPIFEKVDLEDITFLNDAVEVFGRMR
ncbi:MAG: hypothetical protein HUK16_04065 [Bacteroidales bacterium]|nr:hypothetical protein [Bacteroidales bacterium]